VPNWLEVLDEIRTLRDTHARDSQGAADTVRRRYLAQLHQHTGRNVIAYYSGWMSKPGIAQTEINDEDMNGFMMAVHRLDRRQGLDLILHTPGGSMAATQAIVDYLHKMFGRDIRAIVPQIAMSAGTMIACSCAKIVMAKHSNLGPTDPHLNGIPAAGIIEEFKRAIDEITSDSARIPLWQAIIGQYPPTFLSQCENAVVWARAFVGEQLNNVMFAGQPDALEKARAVVERLTDYSGNKTHSRHIPFEECRDDIGLNVEALEADSTLQDLVLTIHHCFMHALMNTPSYKIIENHLGIALVKQQQQQAQLVIGQGAPS
jgi:ATP-dependent protease ClpP protease subunit